MQILLISAFVNDIFEDFSNYFFQWNEMAVTDANSTHFNRTLNFQHKIMRFIIYFFWFMNILKEM